MGQSDKIVTHYINWEGIMNSGTYYFSHREMVIIQPTQMFSLLFRAKVLINCILIISLYWLNMILKYPNPSSLFLQE